MLALIRSSRQGLLALLLALTPSLSIPASSTARVAVGPSAPPVPIALRQGATDATDAASAPESETPDRVFQQALELERQHDWSKAIGLYEDALDRWPSRAEFRHRLRLCETHYRLGRRYQDRSFREELLRLPRTDAIALYEELLERIETAYVEPIEFDPLLRHGFDNLEVALRDPVFLKAHGVADQPDRIRWLRDAYQSHRQRVAVQNRSEAKEWVEAASDLGHRALGLPEAAIVLEFVYGACDALDDYSGCLTPDRMADLYAEIDGNFVGIGVELKKGDRGLLMVGVIPGGPAAEAGLKVGEEIVEVDGRSLTGLGLDAAAATLQGGEGSDVTVSVLGTDGSVRHVTMVRRPVEVRSVESLKLFEGGIGYIRLVGFQKTTLDEMDQAVASLQARGMTHLILDVRGNPGGLLNVSVDLADQFLSQGRIVMTRGRAPGQTFDYTASAARPWSMPVTVLIDGDSASASEILAGALKDNHRALIIGERSFGKGSVQSIYPLRAADAALKLTTAKFYSPTNRPYSERGVSPDIEVRSSARPSSDADSLPVGIVPFGDPERDPPLRMAIRRAREEGRR